ncbi:MAG: glutamate synthase-related protein [Deltaproteobacteria bacterium]|nr:glutamate synthase-related protein [Deltaproteobacteria bacterium]
MPGQRSGIERARTRRLAAMRADPGRGGCGIVALGELTAPASHELVKLALRAIARMEHRGGTLEGTGDGAGLLLKPERSFFEAFLAPGKHLPDPREPLIVGVAYFLPGERNIRQHQRAVDATLRRLGLAPLGWREVPTDPSVLGSRAREDVPAIHQVLVGKGHLRESQLPLVLHEAKNSIEEQHGGAIALPSLQPYTTVYKVLGTARQLEAFYPDLHDPRLATRVILGHRRFATNTFSNWHLVQPFRLLAHNGEINTITANVRAAQDIDSALHFQCRLMPSGSDSAQLDRVAEMMAVHGMRDVAEALRRLMPPPWQEEERPERERRFFEANGRAMGTLAAWEGPAAITATDGHLLVGLIDRMGLRPLRWARTHAGRVVISSEMGAVPLPFEEIAADGQLEPGEMIIADLTTGELHAPEQTTAFILERSKLDFQGLSTEGLSSVATVHPDKEALTTRALNIFGWTRERVRDLQATVKESSPPVRSMGNDLPLAIFSGNPSRLYSFLAQIVAVVTNPPIDPLREGGAMDTRVYLGRSPKMSKLSQFRTWPQVEHPHPVLTNEDIAGLLEGGEPDLAARRFDATFEDSYRGARGMVRRIHEVAEEVVEAVKSGVSIIVLSDLEATRGARLPVPMVLLVGVVHRALASRGLRRNASLVVETGEVHEGHDLAALLAYGATAVNPYAMFHIARETRGLTPEAACQSLVGALVASLRRIMSKMGITTLAGYRGSSLFEAIGLSEELVDYFLPDTASFVGGLTLDEVYGDIRARAGMDDASIQRNANKPLYRKEVTDTLQLVARQGNAEGDYDRFAKLVAESPPVYLRDLLELDIAGDPTARPLPLSDVASAAELIRSTVRGAGMSHGALHSTAQRAIAAAFNHFGSFSNSGEGGEDERRNPGGPWEGDRSRARQVASGRFGVDATYLMGADELEIKIGQGAKPGEGGHLPGHKVTAEIAKIRKVRQGVPLISPPPHHDIYSIEDLSQLITHLRQVNPRARIAVKVPAVTNLGTIVVGVAKAGAEVITISGAEGGTGAAYVGSIKHAGLPLERGLAEAHQHLVQSGIRHRTRLRADGGLKCGADLAKVLALGADEVSLGTVLMVAENCVFCRGCNKGTCPVGIATQDDEMHQRFMRRGREDEITESTPLDARHHEAKQGVIRYLECLGEDLRARLAALGLRHASELTGRVDLLRQRRTGQPRWDHVDLSDLLVDLRSGGPAPRQALPALHAASTAKNREILEAAAAGDRIELWTDSAEHGLGATLAGELAGTPAPGRVVRLETTGYAGQGLGFAATRGMELRHVGYANDAVGEVMGAGARIVVLPAPSLGLEEGAQPSLVGNAAAYGATGGTLLIAGRAGQRFGVRNSGATLICEGAGKYAFEYMTGGVGVLLGSCGPCIGSGMTGGLLYFHDPEGGTRAHLHRDVAAHAGELEAEDLARLGALLEEHLEQTGSARARSLLAGREGLAASFFRVRVA